MDKGAWWAMVLWVAKQSDTTEATQHTRISGVAYHNSIYQILALFC